MTRRLLVSFLRQFAAFVCGLFTVFGLALAFVAVADTYGVLAGVCVLILEVSAVAAAITTVVDGR